LNITNINHKQHLKSLPVVSDSIDTIKSNPYGAKSIEIADTAYTKVGEALEPHLRTPYSYAKPYVNKADSIADNVLNSVENHFPIVKANTDTILSTAKGYALWPLQLTMQSRDYVINTWSDEYNKTAKRNSRGSGLIVLAMAFVSTELRMVSDALQVVVDYLGPKKDQAKQKKDAAVDKAKEKKDTYAEALQH